jgi:hypothetical protein
MYALVIYMAGFGGQRSFRADDAPLLLDMRAEVYAVRQQLFHLLCLSIYLN